MWLTEREGVKSIEAPAIGSDGKFKFSFSLLTELENDDLEDKHFSELYCIKNISIMEHVMTLAYE